MKEANERFRTIFAEMESCLVGLLVLLAEFEGVGISVGEWSWSCCGLRDSVAK